MIEVTSSSGGPLFDGRAEAAVDAFLDDAEVTVARRGVDMVQVALDQVLRHPTGRYRGSITTDRRAGDSVIHDSRVIYGPWLEGTGSRNKTTRFKGYATFRRTRAAIQAVSGQIAETVLQKYLGRMG